MELMLVHWVFLALLAVIIGLIVAKKDTMIIYLLAILVLGLCATGSILSSVEGVFGSLLYAFSNLLGIILAISCVSALGMLLEKTGIIEIYLKPIVKLIKNKYIGFWIIGVVALIFALFFNPSPAVVLVAIIFLPVAKQINMPILWVAVALNLFAHGFASSGDYVLRAGPTLVAEAAQIPTESLMLSSVPLWLTMGIVTTTAAFAMLCRSRKKIKNVATKPSPVSMPELNTYDVGSKKGFFAVLVGGLLATDVILMFAFSLSSNSASALLCGTVIILICVISIFGVKKANVIDSTFIDGMKYSMTLFARVLPMAAFFYLGDTAFSTVYGDGILSAGSQGIVNDIGLALTKVFDVNEAGAVLTTGAMGAITGLDGSGLSGISLVGTVANLLTTTMTHATATAAAFGQILAKYVGSGCLIPAAALPVAMACGIDVVELIKTNFKPILIGAAVTAVVAIFLA
jgi:hypothetical protein